VRARVLLALGVVGVLLGAGPVRGVEQRITPLNPSEEQRIEHLGHPDDVAGVDAVPIAGADQAIAPAEPPSPAVKAASTAGKVVLGVTAAGLALGAMAASLLFL
jgi:hypothetical protein